LGKYLHWLVSIRPAIEMNGQIRTAFVVNCLLDFDEIWLKVIPGSYEALHASGEGEVELCPILWLGQ
jgi:hypothetical protein